MSIYSISRQISIGQRWVKNFFQNNNCLLHYGIKGQKWGRRNGPPYPLKRSGNMRIVSSKTSGVIDDAIKKGEVILKINSDKQYKHTLSHHLPERSYLNGDNDYAQKLVNELSGTGKVLIGKDGKWSHKEWVTANRTIGTHVNVSDRTETETNKATIIYSKTGTHIFPRKGDVDD